MLAKITSKNQLTLPKAAVEAVDNAEYFEIEVRAGQLVLTPVRMQRADGCWDEDLYTGTGFPGDFYINYELYRLVFPLSALGRYLAAKRGAQ